MVLHCANTAERIEVLLWAENLADPRYTVLDESLSFLRRFDEASNLHQTTLATYLLAGLNLGFVLAKENCSTSTVLRFSNNQTVSHLRVAVFSAVTLTQALRP